MCKSTHLDKLRNATKFSNRRQQRQIPNGTTNDTPVYSQMTDAEILKTTMTGFSEVIW